MLRTMRLPLRFFVASVSMGILGCTTTTLEGSQGWLVGVARPLPPTLPPAHVNYPQADPLPLAIQLTLNDALLNTTQEFRAYDSHVTLQIGRSVAESSRSLASAVFQSVREAKGDLPLTSGVDAVLTPRVANIRFEMGMWAWQKCRIEIALEWSLIDLAGRVIWADTFVGRGEGACGSRFTYLEDAKEIARIAIEEVMTASYRDMVATR